MTKDTTLTATGREWPTYTIDTVYASHVPISTPHGSLEFDSASPAPKCTLVCTPAALYAGKWQGGTVYYPSKDTLIISVTADSTVTATEYMIPVIDSIRDSTALRDSTYLQAARPGDTIKVYCPACGDSGTGTAMNLNSNGSVKLTLLSWQPPLIVGIVPAGTPRGFYRSWAQTGDVIVGSPKRYALLIKTPGGL